MESEIKHGHIEVVCGSMFSGKTEELIRRIKRAKIAKQKIQVFKPKKDSRYQKENVCSHDGVDWVAVPIESSLEILSQVKEDTQVVAVDEAQFFDKDIVVVCNKLADEGRRVIVAGLDTDFRADPFGSVPELLAQAEIVDKLRAICVVCGGPASRTQRLTEEKEVVLVGAAEKYEARCRHCHAVSNSN